MSAYSLEEVSEHNSASSLWIIIEGGVYDVTDYINLHPGGAQALLRNGGKDASTMFRLLHGDDAWKQLETMRVGHLASDMKQSARENENETQGSLKSLSLDVDQSQRTDTKEGLLRTSVLSVKQDTEGRCCYLQIRNPDSIVFDDKTFPNFGHVLLHVDRNRNDTLVERSAISGFYSPSFICESFIEFVVKPAGEKSTRLCQLEVNAEVWISSTPLKPNVPSNQVPSTFLSIRPVHVTFIGAGSGVTPFLRLLRQIVTRNPIQIPTLTFIVCQSAPEAQVGISAIRSILEMQAVNPTEKTQAVQLKTYFHYSRAPNPCHRINMNDLLQYGVYTSTQVFICGPEAFNKSLHAMFVQLGFQGKSVQIIQ